MGRPSKIHLTSRGTWRTRINGKVHHLGRDKAAAFRRFYELMAASGKSSPRNAPTTVGGLIVAWLQAEGTDDRRWRIRDFAALAGKTLLVDLDHDILCNLHRRIRRQYAAWTIIHRVRAASTCLRWGVSQGWLRGPFSPPKLAKPVRQARDLDPVTTAKALAELPDRAGRLLRFIASTGCRPAEARMLKWSQVRLSAGVCTLTEHKTADCTGTVREIYLTAAATAILRELPHCAGWVFPSRLGKPYTANGLRSIMRSHMDGTPYALRHTFAQVASEQITEQDLAKLMGHRDTKTTRHYYEVKSARARRAAESLELPQVRPHPPQSPPGKRKSQAAGKKKVKSPGLRKARRTGRGDGTGVRRRA